ncbi:TPA: ribonuclease H [Candidatus Dependentiae bacterium]|nr:MAG: Ribonuclease HI [candidate division TM6 bacterium GW2011_GWF2_43_87]HBL98578.1 ribonuclease H [Candidatus Dependentiae bacterium]
MTVGQSQTCILFIDGAARNNPGPAGAGICLKCGESMLFCEGFYLGSLTNNQAEYRALLLGLAAAQDFLAKGSKIVIFSDSELLVRQILGIYKVKKPELIVLYERAKQLLEFFEYTIRHVRREENKQADLMANKGVDSKKVVPELLRQRVGV